MKLNFPFMSTERWQWTGLY